MPIARINGKIIEWAMRRSGATLDSLATKAIGPDKVAAWVSGDAFPSEGQAVELADRLNIAYPMLFMRKVPPDVKIKVPDLRTTDGQPLTKPSQSLLKVLDSIRARQNWFREEMVDAGKHPLSFVSKFAADASPEMVAADMRKQLGIDVEARREAGNYEGFLKTLISRAEDLGVLVMRSGVVGHATTRTLDVSEFRGFALIDDLAPVIFINDKDAKAAQIFTFAHEAAHLWIGASGISDRSPTEKGDSKNAIEIRCDAIAAEFLAPEAEFLSFWKSSQPLDKNLADASRSFNVSSLVVLRRAKDLNLISTAGFYKAVTEQYERYKRVERERLEGDGVAGEKKRKRGGNFWASFEIRNGKKFNASVVSSVRERRTTYAEAGSLFGINPGAAARYVQKVGS